MKPAKKRKAAGTKFFDVRLTSVPTGIPICFDLYLLVGGEPVLFRKSGDLLATARVGSLKKHGATGFLVPEDQRAGYFQTLSDSINNPDIDRKQRGRIIKESAFIHVHDLFTKRDIKPVVEEAKNLVEEMVTFVTDDVDAIVSLMRLSVHDYYTYNHCVDVAVYSIALARRIIGNNRELLFLAGFGGLLHDVGKRRIDKQIINKSSVLTPEEWNEIKKHPLYGLEYLRDVGSVPREAKQVVYEHHENFDGTGYPRGLKQDEISKLARIVTIADVFDALTTDRSYHSAVTPMEALDTMYAMQPGKFDPNVFRSFNKNFDKKSKLTLPKDFDPCQVRKMVKQSDE